MSTNQLTWSHRLAACLRLVSLRAKYIRTTICILITAHTCRRMPLNHLQRKQNGEKSREIEGNRGKSREIEGDEPVKLCQVLCQVRWSSHVEKSAYRATALTNRDFRFR